MISVDSQNSTPLTSILLSLVMLNSFPQWTSQSSRKTMTDSPKENI